MPSLQSQLVIFMLRHSHWLRPRAKRTTVIDWNTSIPAYRQEVERSSGMLGKLPEGITVSPVTIDTLHAEWIRFTGAPDDRAILYFHGGGYVSGTCQAHRPHVAKFVRASGTNALVFEYRRAPEHPFPAALEDAQVAYHWLLSQGILPSNIVFVGDSAGGGLALATLLALRDKGHPLPAAAVAVSPWTDLKCTGASLKNRAKVDPFTPGNAWNVFSKHYVADKDPGLPWISPLYGDLSGLPPLLIYAGDYDVLVDDSIRFAEKARTAGVDVLLRVGEGMFHCYPVCDSLFPEARQAMAEIGAYIRAHLDTPVGMMSSVPMP